MGFTSGKDVDRYFSYQKPSEDGVKRIQRIREAAHAFAATILGNTPACADQSTAIRKVREAVMTANAAIVLEQAAAVPSSEPKPSPARAAAARKVHPAKIGKRA